jgi:hypothetical protein
MKMVAILLIVLGLAGMIVGGLTWTRSVKVVDIGPIEVNKEEKERIPISPIAGAAGLLAGVILLAYGKKSASA